MSGRRAAWLVAAIALAGAIVRVAQLDQSLVADELWTYIEATRFDFGGMFDYVRSVQEMTPPLFTVLVWLTAHISESAAVTRIPSVAAGILTIPLVFLIGDRTIGRRAAVIAAVLTALSPILIWYSIELRAYSVAVLLSSASTLLLLIATERRRAGWWVGYAVLVAAAMYTHYTAVYVLAAGFAWALIFRPEARRSLLLATLGAAVLFAPWLGEVRADFNAPGQDIISRLAPFTFDSFLTNSARVVLGPPLVPMREFYGLLPLMVFAGGVVVGVAGAAANLRSRLHGELAARVALPLMLAIAAPAGAALTSLIGDDQYLPRNLLTSVPGILLVLAGIICAGPVLTRVVSGVAIVGVFAFGTVRSFDTAFQRNDYDGAAAFIDANATAADVVLDVPGGTVGGLNGAPLTPAAYTLDVALDEPHRIYDALDVPTAELAMRKAEGGRLFIVGPPVFVALGREGLGLEDPPAESRLFPGEIPVEVDVYDVPVSPRRR